MDGTTDAAVELSWSTVAGATGYELQRRSPPETGTWTTVYGPDSATSYEDEAVSAATGYGYRVRAVVSDRGESAWGDEEVATTPGQAPPATPEELEAEAESSTSIRLTWSAVDGADKYVLERRTGQEDWVTLDVVNATDDPGFTDTGLTANTTYQYRVKAAVVITGGSLDSGWSDSASATTDP